MNRSGNILFSGADGAGHFLKAQAAQSAAILGKGQIGIFAGQIRKILLFELRKVLHQ